MMFPVPAVFTPPVGEDTQEGNLLGIEKGNHPVVEHIGGRQGVFPVVQLAEGDSSIVILIVKSFWLNSYSK
jgi:hypothetical protein